MSEGSRLPLDTILHVATETESRIWAQGGITDEREDSLQQDPGDVGMCILRHGTSTKDIHSYFMNLEQRKCCLLLAACKQRFFSVRLVRNDGRDSGIEEGAMMKSSPDTSETVAFLDAEEFQVFQQTLKCAAFPVLGAPEPPSESTPVPMAQSHKAVTRTRKDTGESLHYNRTMTPLSFNDSGVEEQEDTAMVPSETLCELLRRAFKLTTDKFNQYEEIIAAQLEKKSPQKILAEELVRQLIALENNQNPYYNPKTFLNRTSYDHWQQKERMNITELLGKFWHFSLPQLSDRSITMTSNHKQYRRLLEKLISYESPYRQTSELIAPPPTSPLSSASVRLLKEFGMRYGVGEQYRKIVYLNYLSLNFDPTVWFIHHVTSSLTSVMESMPTKRSCLIITKEEFSILENSLHLLEAKSSAAIAKMKTLFMHNKPLDGVEALIELLSLTLQAKTYLLMSPEEQLGNKLFKIVQGIFPTTYERHKMVSQDELRHNKWDVELSPKLLNMLIGHVRDEVLDYKQFYQPAFQKYFNITGEAAQEFYKLLMADVQELLKQTRASQTKLEVNKLMLSLAYRLNQLDHDWNIYLSPQMQTWRDLILVEAQHWAGMIKIEMQKMVTLAVSRDRYGVCELEWSTSHQRFNHRNVKQRTVSKLLTPSQNSAFTSTNSALSTPNQMSSGPTRMQADVHKEQPSTPKQTFRPEFPVQSTHIESSFPKRRPSSDPVNVSHSSVLNGSYLGDMARSLGHYDEENLLSFAQLRHSSSLPNIPVGQKYIEMVPTTFRNGLDSRTSKRTSEQAYSRQDSNLSPEVSGIMSLPVNFEHTEESEDTGTLTDDSGSQEGDFRFPPLQEVKSPSPVQLGSITESTISPTHALSPVSNKKFAQSVNSSSGLVKPAAQHLSSKSSGYATSSLPAKPVATKPVTQLKEQVEKLQKPVSQTSPTRTVPAAQASMFQRAEIRYSSSPITSASFTNSLTSNISLPHPPGARDKVLTDLLISGSAVDVIVILQRLVGIGRVLCLTLAPARHGYESDQSAFTSSREDDLPCPPVYTKSRQKMYDCFLSAIRGTVSVFVDNMLCLDLCGTTQLMAGRLAGSRLIEYLRTQQASGFIWGCRHDYTPNKNCGEYLNKNTSLLCDRHEPITRKMCHRVNNVWSMLTCLDWFHHCLGNAFGFYGDLTVKQNRRYRQDSVNSTDMIRSEFVILESYRYDPNQDKSEVMETASQLCPSLPSQPEDGLVVSSPIDSDKDHVMAVLRALCRVMAYRLNLFVADALPVLLSLKRSSVSIEVGLQPITDFLAGYIRTLSGWLYQDPYRRVLECLWIFIVEDFEAELGKMERSEDDTEGQGQLLLQALAHLLKFMNNQHEDLRRELLLSQAEDVSFRLSLYAMPLTQLISIYRGLTAQEGPKSEVSSNNTDYQTILMVRQRLKHDLEKLRKGFSGMELIQWILNNQELFFEFDPSLSENNQSFTRETAHVIAQRFLDWNLIADVEGEAVRGGSPTAGLEDAYPDITIHAQVVNPGNRDLTHSLDSDNDKTPFTTPRATPRPGLRASLRAASRSSGYKSATPGMRYFDRSHLMSSARSQRFQEGDFKTTSQGQQKTGGLKPASNVNPVEFVKNVSGEDQNATVDSLGGSYDSTLQWSTGANRGPDFDPYLIRETPLSLSSAISHDSTTAQFFESSGNFYYVCPYIGEEQEPTWQNYELFHLVEECFQKKVSAQYILRIIYSRRKYDPRARAFLKFSPFDEVERIRFGHSQEEVSVCVSS